MSERGNPFLILKPQTTQLMLTSPLDNFNHEISELIRQITVIDYYFQINLRRNEKFRHKMYTKNCEPIFFKVQIDSFIFHYSSLINSYVILNKIFIFIQINYFLVVRQNLKYISQYGVLYFYAENDLFGPKKRNLFSVFYFIFIKTETKSN